MADSGFTLNDLTKLASPETQDWFVNLVLEAHERRGADWLEALKKEWPYAAWLADLAVNKTADEAINEIADVYSHLPIRLFAANHIRTFHARVQNELDKKRNL